MVQSGIEANTALVVTVQATVAEIRRVRGQTQALAAQRGLANERADVALRE